MTDAVVGETKQQKRDTVTTSRFHMTLARRKVLWAYIFLAIPIVFFLYIRIYPTLFAFQMSAYDWNPLAAEQRYVGLENYQTLFSELGTPGSTTQAAFGNTAKYVVLGMPIQLVLALLVALMLNEIRFMVGVYRVMFFLPFVTSTIAISWVFRWLYQPRIGLFNVLLEAFSLPQQPFLRSTDQALYSIMAVVIWQGLGFAVIIFLAGLKQIPRVYYEAAKVDGANRWQSFWKITFPLLNPVIVYLVVLQSIGFLRMFAEVLAMSPQGDGGPLNSTTTVVLRVYREAFQSLNMGYASTLTVALFAIIMVITIIQLRVLRRDIEL
jgi:multiple sugar transport system permease protein